MSHLASIQNAGGYGSEFESDCDADRKRKSQRGDMSRPEKITKHQMPSKQEVSTEYTKEEGRAHRFHFTSLDAYSRHKKLVNDYILYYGGNWADFKREPRTCKSDLDIVRENQQFLWDDNDDIDLSWEKRIAKKYYDKLFKEYCIADLSRYKENAIALRWRVEKEIVEGKGQFICGNKKCEERKSLRTWEVNFGYRENDQKKNALVKLRLCTECSYRLNYHHKKRELTKNTVAISSGVVQKDVYEGLAASEKRNTSEKTDVTSEGSTSKNKGNIWSGPAKVVEEKTRNDEFDEYFEDMFL